MSKSTKAVPLLLSALTILASVGCEKQSAPAIHENVRREQVLPLTFGGFLKDGSETEKIGGVCGTDDTRILLNCDIYNGLSGWTISEVTLDVIRVASEGDSARRYNVPITIKPLTTEHVTVRLGLQLPPDTVFKSPHGKVTTRQRWAWQSVGAKGYPAK